MIDIILPEEQTMTKWSGGITRELYIMPRDASYVKRNFELRLSGAVISDEESFFTALPNYQRTLMLLEGIVKLQHGNAPIKELSVYEADCFDGGAVTKSYGKCSDFNIMVQKNAPFTAEIEYSKQTDKMLLPSEYLQFIYILKGRISMVSTSGVIEAGEKSLAAIKEANEVLELRAVHDKAEYIYVRLKNKA